jgi:hypothetical protein
MWEEIHGFESPGEYNTFVRYIESLVKSREIEEVDPDPTYGRGEIYGGRWFKDLETEEVWRLVPPDFPFRGLWEPVEIF